MHGASAYHAIGYGATLAIWTIRGGEVTAYVDLHPYLRAKLPDGTVLEMGDRASVARVAEARAADEDWAWFDDVILELRWTEVAAMLERLVPPLLAIGERMTVKNPWADAPRGRRVATCLRSEIAFGSYDHESGEDLEQPFEIA